MSGAFGIVALTESVTAFGLAADAAEQAARQTEILGEAAVCGLTDAFFSSGSGRLIPPGTAAPAARLGYFPDGFYPADEFYTPARRAFSAAGIPETAGFLALFLCFYPRTREIYRTYGIPERVLNASVGCIGADARAHFGEHGFFGVSDAIWASCFLIPELFQVGSLQFRLCRFPYPDFALDGYTVREGDAVIQVHVPDGADLSAAALDDAYSRAVELFGTDVFYADSWLLFPEHQIMLPQTSRIRAFAAAYTLVEEYRTMDYEGLFRVFGRRDAYRYEELPQKTSLQRAYAERVRKKLPIGSAVGVMRRN